MIKCFFSSLVIERAVKNMTDIHPPIHLTKLPNELLEKIAGFLDESDLALFRLICLKFNQIASYRGLLQPFYNRLYAIDQTLPCILPAENHNALVLFNWAVHKICYQQQQERLYLNENHKEELWQLFNCFQPNTLKNTITALEENHQLLDKINTIIIQSKINALFNPQSLRLTDLKITRLPNMLIQDAKYSTYWQNLQFLYCENNQISILNLTLLKNLKILICHNNQLTHLNIDNLTEITTIDCSNNLLKNINLTNFKKIQKLFCDKNKITHLNLTGTKALKILDCNHNPLIDLNLHDSSPQIKNQFTELETKLIGKQLSLATNEQEQNILIGRLDERYTANLLTDLMLVDNNIYLPSFNHPINNDNNSVDIEPKQPLQVKRL